MHRKRPHLKYEDEVGRSIGLCALNVLAMYSLLELANQKRGETMSCGSLSIV